MNANEHTTNKGESMFNNRNRITLLLNGSKSFDRKVLEGIGAYLRFNQVNWNLNLEENVFENFDANKLSGSDGIIADFSNKNLQSALMKSSIAMVGVGGSYEKPKNYPDAPYITTDNFALIELAFLHLKNKGIETFAFYGMPANECCLWSIEREKAFISLCQTNNYEYHIYRGSSINSKSLSNHSDSLSQWLKMLPAATGVVAVNDVCARDILKACDHNNILVPEHLSVIGIDDDELTRFLSRVSLSSVSHGYFDIGFQAAKKLHQIMRGQKCKHKPYLIAPEKVNERQSTDFKAIKDIYVIQAMHYIRQNACRGIKVDQVLDSVGISRSNLELRFKEECGHSIHNEIHYHKLHYACSLLKNTNKPTGEVANVSGYPSLQYMYTLFKKHFNKTPLEYRNQPQHITNDVSEIIF